MIVQIRLAIWNPRWPAIHKLPCPPAIKAEATEHTRGLHGGEALPPPGSLALAGRGRTVDALIPGWPAPGWETDVLGA
jgi:hypothetical protein